jgi:hypothetical protein
MNSMKTLTVVALAAAALAATAVPSQALTRLFPGHGPVVLGNLFGTHKITCLACNLPRPYRPFPIWGHGQRYWGHDWYRWHPVYFRGGAPVATAPVAAAATSMAAPQAPTGACNCLTKQMLPNGAELLQDICTQQSAVAMPQATAAQ